MTQGRAARSSRRPPLGAAGTLSVGVGAAALLVALAAHTTPSGYRPRPRPLEHYTPASGASSSPPSAPTVDNTEVLRTHASSGSILLVFLIALVALALVAVVAGLQRVVSPRARRGRHSGSSTDASPELVRRLRTVVQSGLDDLERRPVREAIIACWLAVRDAAVEAGLRPHAADTPAEFVARVLAGSNISPQPLRALAELYREARFSTHAMTDADRSTARAALEAIRSDLSVGAGV